MSALFARFEKARLETSRFAGRRAFLREILKLAALTNDLDTMSGRDVVKILQTMGSCICGDDLRD